MLEPRPEMRTATRFLAIASPGELKVTGKAHLRHAGPERNDTAELRQALAGVAPRLDRRLGTCRIEHRHHADPAVEGAQHLGLRSEERRVGTERRSRVQACRSI